MRHLEVQAVLAARQVGQLRDQRLERGRDRKRDHGVEDGAHAQAGQADQQGEGQRYRQAGSGACEYGRPPRLQAYAGDGNAISADPEEHRVGEADDAGIAQQQVIAGHQHHEHQNLRCDGKRFRTWKEERRHGQGGHDRDEKKRQHGAAGRIAGKQAYGHVGGS
ncbi:hypothetical protein D9M70_535730 [compost metagenome]